MIKSSINRGKIKRKQKEKSPGTYPSRLEIFTSRWLEKKKKVGGRLNKRDIDGVKTRILIQYY